MNEQTNERTVAASRDTEWALAFLVLAWWETQSQKEPHNISSGRINPGEFSSTDEETEAEGRDLVAILHNI